MEPTTMTVVQSTYKWVFTLVTVCVAGLAIWLFFPKDKKAKAWGYVKAKFKSWRNKAKNKAKNIKDKAKILKAIEQMSPEQQQSILATINKD